MVVDSSPIIALLNGEPGSEGLADRLDGAAISAVNHSEIVGRIIELGIDRLVWRSGLDALGLEIVPFDMAASEIAGALLPATKPHGLGLGDRACLALALMRGEAVLTADRSWAKLDIDVKVELIR
jgi:PIN domain nuclease of toxin-antitoxin system